MDISLEGAGKRFNRDWIFRNLSYQFEAGKKYAVTGPNGSGKSTLLQVIAAGMNVTEGNIHFKKTGKEVPSEEAYRHIAIAAPYLEVVEEMTAEEFLGFHRVFKQLALPVNEILSVVGLEAASGKQVRNFSSGMKQRIKLAQAVFSNVPVILLDEPCTNLDEAGYALYHQLIDNYCRDKLVIVSSNDPNEYSFCEYAIKITDYKS